MKMAFQLVSLLTTLLVGLAWGQFQSSGGGYNPYHQPFPQGQHNNGGQQKVNPKMLSCIGASSNDFQSQVRLTLTPLDSPNQHPLGHLGGGFAGHLGLGFGGLGAGGAGGNDMSRRMQWRVEGLVLPSTLVDKSGTFQFGLFKGGRTFGTCKSSALGEVLHTNNHPTGGLGGYGSPYGSLFGSAGPINRLTSSFGFNPFGSLFGGGGYHSQHQQQQQQHPNGIISNPVVISSGTTVYAGIINQVSFNDLVGRSLAACQAIQNKRCLGRIPFCCSITRDALPADEVYVEPQYGASQGGFGASQQVGVLAGAGGSLGTLGGSFGTLGGSLGTVGAGGGGALPAGGSGSSDIIF